MGLYPMYELFPALEVYSDMSVREPSMRKGEPSLFQIEHNFNEGLRFTSAIIVSIHFCDFYYQYWQ